jgi:hypothetical protein
VAEPKPATYGVLPLPAKKMVIGLQITNQKNEDLGRIEDLVIDPMSGRITFAILSFKSGHDIRDKHFAIPWDKLTFDLSAKRALLNIEKALIEKDAGFDPDKWPTLDELIEKTSTNMGY